MSDNKTTENIAAEIGAGRMLAAWLRNLQFENQCPETGKPCRDTDGCGCVLEIKEWCKDA